MSLFWLAYRQKGVVCVVIQPAAALITARLKASLEFDIDDCFISGHELGVGQEVPAGMIGRLLSQAEAAKLLKSLERQIPKKSATASISQQARKVRSTG